MLTQRFILLFLLMKTSQPQMIGTTSVYPNCLLRRVRNTFLNEYKLGLKFHPPLAFTQIGYTKQVNDGSHIPSRFRKRNLVRGRGMAFPSLETTLLTLSFLTFAVYLVNLIQVLIQGMKGNNSGN